DKNGKPGTKAVLIDAVARRTTGQKFDPTATYDYDVIRFWSAETQLGLEQHVGMLKSFEVAFRTFHAGTTDWGKLGQVRLVLVTERELHEGEKQHICDLEQFGQLQIGVIHIASDSRI